mgnify:FL=1
MGSHFTEFPFYLEKIASLLESVKFEKTKFEKITFFVRVVGLLRLLTVSSFIVPSVVPQHSTGNSEVFSSFSRFFRELNFRESKILNFITFQ